MTKIFPFSFQQKIFLFCQFFLTKIFLDRKFYLTKIILKLTKFSYFYLFQVTEVHMQDSVGISCSQDGTVRFWNLLNGGVIRVIHNKLHIQHMAVDHRFAHTIFFPSIIYISDSNHS